MPCTARQPHTAPRTRSGKALPPLSPLPFSSQRASGWLKSPDLIALSRLHLERMDIQAADSPINSSSHGEQSGPTLVVIYKENCFHRHNVKDTSSRLPPRLACKNVFEFLISRRLQRARAQISRCYVKKERELLCYKVAPAKQICLSL